PLQSVLIGISCFLFGRSLDSVFLVTVLESIATLFFSAKLFLLLYGENKKNSHFVWLILFFVFFSPVFLEYGASASLDPGLMFFTTATLYYFTAFLKTEEKKNIYLTAIFLALGISLKNPMFLIIPALFIAFFLEKKAYLFREKKKELFIASIIFFIVLLPWMISQSVFYYKGIGHITHMASIATKDFDGVYDKNWASFARSIFFTFGEITLILFFLYHLCSLLKKRKTGEITLAIFFFEILLFYNLFAHIEPRYMLVIIPIAVIFSVRGIQTVFEKYPSKKRYLNIILIFMLFHAMLFSFGYFVQQKNNHLATDFMAAAEYIVQENHEKSTVMSSFSRQQAVAFNVLNDRNLYVVHPPRDHSKEEDLAELKLMLNNSFPCVQHPLKTDWEKFGLCHPPINYIIVHERYDGQAMKYKLKEEIINFPEFELIKTIEGSKPNNRIFIYERQ
ncbi:MAG: glycosyltransferase family 39 protein, partial [Candidatus Aenigmarchaeota archaeon]|nr:glycosyltransferase family 39 protein [Candidatus Aenigmarchaeota archaeon]